MARMKTNLIASLLLASAACLASSACLDPSADGNLVPPTVDGDPTGKVELGSRRRAVVAAEAFRAVAGDRRDRTARVDAYDDVIEIISDVQASVRIEREAEGLIEHEGGGCEVAAE